MAEKKRCLIFFLLLTGIHLAALPDPLILIPPPPKNEAQESWLQEAIALKRTALAQSLAARLLKSGNLKAGKWLLQSLKSPEISWLIQARWLNEVPEDEEARIFLAWRDFLESFYQNDSLPPFPPSYPIMVDMLFMAQKTDAARRVLEDELYEKTPMQAWQSYRYGLLTELPESIRHNPFYQALARNPKFSQETVFLGKKTAESQQDRAQKWLESLKPAPFQIEVQNQILTLKSPVFWFQRSALSRILETAWDRSFQISPPTELQIWVEPGDYPLSFKMNESATILREKVLLNDDETILNAFHQLILRQTLSRKHSLPAWKVEAVSCVCSGFDASGIMDSKDHPLGFLLPLTYKSLLHLSHDFRATETEVSIWQHQACKIGQNMGNLDECATVLHKMMAIKEDRVRSMMIVDDRNTSD